MRINAAWRMSCLLFISALFFAPSHAMDFENDLGMLKSLPYSSWTEEDADPDLKGVVHHDAGRSFKGYNLFGEMNQFFFVMDMEGNIVHTWTYPEERYIQHAEFIPEDGNLIMLLPNAGLARMNWHSNLLTLRVLRTHHDFDIAPNGRIFACIYRIPYYYRRRVRFGGIVETDWAGKAYNRWISLYHVKYLLDEGYQGKSLLDLPPLEDNVVPSESGILFTSDPRLGEGDRNYFEMQIPSSAEFEGLYDYDHLNTVAVLPDTPLGRRDGRFAAGNIMTCLRNNNLIVILDGNMKRVQWAWGRDELDLPHMPTMLENGHILVFDNGNIRKWSRVIEVDPVTDKIVWEYKADPPEDFYSGQRGSAQRLPNGNTLICESSKGRAFEITPEGEIVWDYWHTKFNDEGKRSAIYRMERLLPEDVEPWLKLESK